MKFGNFRNGRRTGLGQVRSLLNDCFQHPNLNKLRWDKKGLTKIIQLPTAAATAIRQNQAIFREHKDARKVNQTNQLQEVSRRAF